MSQTKDWLLALVAGVLLSVMISLNGLLAHYSSPVFASWVAHGTGTLLAVAIILLLQHLTHRPLAGPLQHTPPPRWSYFGGFFGGLTVVLSSITVNSPLGLSGTLALGLVGQIVFSLLSDQFGWFGLPQRTLTYRDGLAVICILIGSLFIIFFRA